VDAGRRLIWIDLLDRGSKTSTLKTKPNELAGSELGEGRTCRNKRLAAVTQKTQTRWCGLKVSVGSSRSNAHDPHSFGMIAGSIEYESVRTVDLKSRCECLTPSLTSSFSKSARPPYASSGGSSATSITIARHLNRDLGQGRHTPHGGDSELLPSPQQR
jgi:hypothetical protein